MMGEPDVKKIRKNLGFTQDSFAASFGFSLHQVRQWEQGQRNPSKPAQTLLWIISMSPEVVETTIAHTRAVA
jgi:putative transcriptional regulator